MIRIALPIHPQMHDESPAREEQLPPAVTREVGTQRPSVSFKADTASPLPRKPRRSRVPPGSTVRQAVVGSVPTASHETSTDVLLHRLRETAKTFGNVTYSSDPDVAPTANNPGCVEKSIVKVFLKTEGRNREYCMDANHIDIADNGDGQCPTCYIAGRSPNYRYAPSNLTRSATPEITESPFNLERYLEFGSTLVQAIESGQGLYQFVWPKTHQHDTGQLTAPHARTYVENERREKSVYEKLTAAFECAEKMGKTLFIDGTYRVDNIEKVAGSELAAGLDYFHYQLSITDLDDKKRTITMTQAGLPLVEGRLAEDQIERAHAILESHHALLSRDQDASKPVPEPMILSTKGRIRNATLIAYTSVAKRIDNHSITTTKNIDDALHDAIAAGYEGRGTKKFIPSPTQIRMLRAALLKRLADRLTGTSDYTNTDAQQTPTRPADDTDDAPIPLTPTHTNASPEDMPNEVTPPDSASVEEPHSPDNLPASPRTAQLRHRNESVGSMQAPTSSVDAQNHAADERAEQPIQQTPEATPPSDQPYTHAPTSQEKTGHDQVADSPDVTDNPDGAASEVAADPPLNSIMISGNPPKDVPPAAEGPPENHRLSADNPKGKTQEVNTPCDTTAQTKSDETIGTAITISRPPSKLQAQRDKGILKSLRQRMGTRSIVAKAFSERAFQLRNNMGDGDCLFHALGGTRTAPSLPYGGWALRNEIADYVMTLTFSREECRYFYKMVAETFRGKKNGEFEKFLAASKSATASTNNHNRATASTGERAAPANYVEQDGQTLSKAQYVYFLRRVGNAAGDRDLQFWLDLVRNKGKTVVVIDCAENDEKIVRFEHRKPRTTVYADQIKGDISEAISDAIWPALVDENVTRSAAPQHLALHRSSNHFQRIVHYFNIQPSPEQKKQGKNVYEEAEDEAPVAPRSRFSWPPSAAKQKVH